MEGLEPRIFDRRPRRRRGRVGHRGDDGPIRRIEIDGPRPRQRRRDRQDVLFGSRQRHHGRTFELRLQRDQRPPARTVAELHAPGTGPRTPAHHPFAHCQQRADAPQRGAVRSRTDLKHRDVLSGLRLFHAAVAAFMGFRRKS